jgi:hypothetical protein
MQRIVHIGLGPLGLRVAAELAQRRLGELAAAVDPSPRLAGRPLAELVPGARPELRVLRSLDELADWKGVHCAVLTTSSDLGQCAGTLRALLSRGVSVVSSCEELLFPWLRHAALAEELDALAKSRGARLLGTGVNPGFVMDALPLYATSVCKSVRSLHAWRIQDATTRRLPFQKKIGAALSPGEFESRAADGSLRHVGLGESIHFLAHYLRWPLDRWDETLEPILADRPLTCGLGPIPRGHAAGVRQVGRGYRSGTAVITLEFQAAIAQPDPHDRIKIEGDPEIDLVLRNGVHGDTATSAILLNCIAPLLRAPPGLHTMATIGTPCSVNGEPDR